MTREESGSVLVLVAVALTDVDSTMVCVLGGGGDDKRREWLRSGSGCCGTERCRQYCHNSTHSVYLSVVRLRVSVYVFYLPACAEISFPTPV